MHVSQREIVLPSERKYFVEDEEIYSYGTDLGGHLLETIHYVQFVIGNEVTMIWCAKLLTIICSIISISGFHNIAYVCGNTLHWLITKKTLLYVIRQLHFCIYYVLFKVKSYFENLIVSFLVTYICLLILA